MAQAVMAIVEEDRQGAGWIAAVHADDSSDSSEEQNTNDSVSTKVQVVGPEGAGPSNESANPVSIALPFGDPLGLTRGVATLSLTATDPPSAEGPMVGGAVSGADPADNPEESGWPGVEQDEEEETQEEGVPAPGAPPGLTTEQSRLVIRLALDGWAWDYVERHERERALFGYFTCDPIHYFYDEYPLTLLVSQEEDVLPLIDRLREQSDQRSRFYHTIPLRAST